MLHSADPTFRPVPRPGTRGVVARGAGSQGPDARAPALCERVHEAARAQGPTKAEAPSRPSPVLGAHLQLLRLLLELRRLLGNGALLQQLTRTRLRSRRGGARQRQSKGADARECSGEQRRAGQHGTHRR